MPWRKKRITAYEVWVSEIMLQQTQVNRVIEYYTKFLKRFPTVESLAKASWEDFLPYYQGLGYYARGRNMLLAAQIVVKDYGGKFPRELGALEKLPGIGPYTARAIASFAYGENYLAWDTNLRRVVGRYFLGGKGLLTKDKEGLFEKKFAKDAVWMNGALMDFGSAICVARPKCEACMFRSQCTYYREKGKRELVSGQQAIVSKEQKRGEKKQDWKNAEVYVFLHEKHRAYYSSSKKMYRPFILSSGYNTRSGIKKYFLGKYGLTLSVRPPQRKVVIQEKAILLVNAQILLGDPRFVVFSKNDVERYTKSSF